MEPLNKFYEMRDGVNGMKGVPPPHQALGASLDSSPTKEQKVPLVSTELNTYSDQKIGEISTTSNNLIEAINDAPVMIGITETQFSKKATIRSSSYEAALIKDNAKGSDDKL
eukprot:UN05973